MEPLNNSVERTKLFSIYSELDEEVVEKASYYDLYLIGGTAIEIWLSHLGLKGWRQRSNNDFDFLINAATNNQLNNFKKFLKHKGFNSLGSLRFRFNKIIIDFFDYEDPRFEFDENLLEPDLFKIIDSLKFVSPVKLMSPVFLFSSKFLRVGFINSVKVKDRTQYNRYIKDLKDLKDLLKIIKKLKLTIRFNKSLGFFYKTYKESDRINLAETFINEELNKLQIN